MKTAISSLSKVVNNDLFARVSFLKDIHLDQSNRDIKSLFYIITQNRVGSGKPYTQIGNL